MYVRERDHVNVLADLSDIDRIAQIAQLCRQTFTAPHELLCAQTLDDLTQRK